ncbi:SMP-30/gluconolactonase/LRE family protein [Luteipulveratus mongoliensis]|uniref:SMP-30/gluconolactonase/LRE family protein n=1 Tax=Luteipulveratus mongoliensis TaxID=571913 RepID=UPI00069883C9|nr:hypothetical protein [Luteipulveratus mongoliensis]
MGTLPVAGWRENLDFDGHGTVWVSRLLNNEVEGLGPDGEVRVRVSVPGPSGIRRGPDGLMYVNFGSSVGSTTAGIMRFDPSAAQPVATPFTTGLAGPNGLAVDGQGNFYVTGLTASNIVKIRPDGSQDTAWTAAANVFSSNGAEVADGTLYVSVLADLGSPIVRVPLDDPGAHSVVSTLSPFPYLPKGLDDLTVLPGNKLVVAAFATGELVRVDRNTGAACLLVQGLVSPTSVRIPDGFGGTGPSHELFVTETTGRILKVTITPK